MCPLAFIRTVFCCSSANFEQVNIGSLLRNSSKVHILTVFLAPHFKSILFQIKSEGKLFGTQN